MCNQITLNVTYCDVDKYRTGSKVKASRTFLRVPLSETASGSLDVAKVHAQRPQLILIGFSANSFQPCVCHPQPSDVNKGDDEMRGCIIMERRIVLSICFVSDCRGWSSQGITPSPVSEQSMNSRSRATDQANN